MYEDNAPPTKAHDLRSRAAQTRQSDPTRAPRNAPVEQGTRLATAARGDSEELRFTWSEFNGRPFLNIRLWSRDISGQWWPVKDKGIAVRRREIAALAEATAAALDLVEALDQTEGRARSEDRR